MVTPVLQEGTALNKGTLEAMKFETIAPIFLSEGGQFANYGVKAGETINKGDYVTTEEVQTNIGTPNQIYLKQESWETSEINYNINIQDTQSLKFVIDGSTYFIVYHAGTAQSNNYITLRLYKVEKDGVFTLKHSIEIADTFSIRCLVPIERPGYSKCMLLCNNTDKKVMAVYFINISDEKLSYSSESKSSTYDYKLYDCLEVGENCYMTLLSDSVSGGYQHIFSFFSVGENGGITELGNQTAIDTNKLSYYVEKIVKMGDGSFLGLSTGYSAIKVEIDCKNYTVTFGDNVTEVSGLSIYDCIRNLDIKDDTYYIGANSEIKKMIIRPSTNTYITLASYKPPATSYENSARQAKPLSIIGEIGDNLIISENPNNRSNSFIMYSTTQEYFSPLHLILIKKDFSGISYPNINIDLAFKIYNTSDLTFYNGRICWTVMVAENSVHIFAYRGYGSSNAISYLHDIQLKPYEKQIRSIENVSEKIIGIADIAVGTYDTPTRVIEQIVEKNDTT